MDSQILWANFVDRDVNVEVVRIAVYNADALMFAVAELGAKTCLNRLEGLCVRMFAGAQRNKQVVGAIGL